MQLFFYADFCAQFETFTYSTLHISVNQLLLTYKLQEDNPISCFWFSVILVPVNNTKLQTSSIEGFRVFEIFYL